MKSKRRKKDNNLKTQNLITSIKCRFPNNKKIHQQSRNARKIKVPPKNEKKKLEREKFRKITFFCVRKLCIE